MVKCRLSRLMGERRINISDLVRETDINRGTINRLYHEKVSRIDLSHVDTLCKYFECEVGELFEYIKDK